MGLERHRAYDPLAVSERPLAAGVRVGGLRYLLRRKLGQGGLSEVWLAWDRQWEQEVAVKLLPFSLRGDSEFVEVLGAAVKRVRQLSQPAIVRTLGLVADQAALGVALEYVEGWSLVAMKVDRPQHRYRPAELKSWLDQLCPALEIAHQEGLVHQEIKPAHLLLSTREQIKLTDFGLAHIVRSRLTRYGLELPSNIAYLSPQQATGAEPGPLDDVYSLGATLYDLLTGTAPFHTGEILAQVCELPPPRLTERLAELGVRETVPEPWEEALAACLAKEPSRRPQTPTQLLRLLEPKSVPKSVPKPPAPPLTAPGFMGVVPTASEPTPQPGRSTAPPAPSAPPTLPASAEPGSATGGSVAGSTPPRSGREGTPGRRKLWLVLGIILAALAAAGAAVVLYLKRK